MRWLLAALALTSFNRSLAAESNPLQSRRDLSRLERSVEATRARLRSTKDDRARKELNLTLGELLIEKARVMRALEEKSEETSKDGIASLRLFVESSPDHPKAPDAMLMIGLERRRLGDNDGAATVLRELTERHPTETAFARAELELGNILAERGQDETATDHFRSAMRSGGASVAAAAALRAGSALLRQGRSLEALLEFEAAVQSRGSQAAPVDDPDGRPLREEALKGSIRAYAETPAEKLGAHPRFQSAVGYYRSFSKDKFELRRWLKELSAALVETKRFDEAARTRELVIRLSGIPGETIPEISAWAKDLRGTKDYAVGPDVLAAVERVFRALRERGPSQELTNAEPVLRDVLTQSHRLAQKDNRPADMLAIAEAYRAYLSFYPNTPQRLNMKLNLAESLFTGGAHAEAGDAYVDLALEMKSTPKLDAKIKAILKSAAQAYELVLKKEKPGTFELARTRAAYRRLAEEQVRRFPADAASATLAFNSAKILYDERRYAESIEPWRRLLADHPSSPVAEQAALLLLDSHLRVGDLEGLVADGNKLKSSKSLGAKTREKVDQAVRAAELERLQTRAGTFASQGYAEAFLEASKSSTDAELRETTLREAFLSFTAAKDPRAAATGAEYVRLFPNRPKAREILRQLIASALLSVDFDRAADWMEKYADAYPTESESPALREQAATLREQLGQPRIPLAAARKKGDVERAIKLAIQFGLWEPLLEIGADLPGPLGSYARGLARLRLEKKAEGLEDIAKVDAADGAPKEMIAHASVILAESRFPVLVRLGKERFSPATLQKLIAESTRISEHLNKALAQGSGRWSVAALAIHARRSVEFGRALRDAKAPEGMSAEQFKALVEPKIEEQRKEALEFAKKCLDLAASEFIPSRYAAMCRSPGKRVVTEKMNMETIRSQTPPSLEVSDAVRGSLLAKPEDLSALRAAYDENAKAGRVHGAYAIASRMVETNASSSEAWTLLGESAARVGRLEFAVSALRKAIELDPKNAVPRKHLTKLVPPRKTQAPKTDAKKSK